MPRGSTQKFYAVLNGRNGPQICGFDEYRRATLNYSGASAKGFLTYEDAERWLNERNHNQHLHLHLHTSTDTSPPMSSSTSPGRLRYPTSTRYWSDHQPIRVDVAIQCPDITLPLPAKVHRGSLAILRPTVLRPLSETIREIPQVDPAPTENIQLSPEQQKVLSVVKSGQNVFFTGPAGTGKSVLLREIIRQLRSTTVVAITATTGIAGLNIGGSTIHSFAGIGLGKEPAEDLAGRINGSRHLHQRWNSTKVLVVDEISMMDATLFDKLEYIARHVRHCQKPFGGIQLVLCGDFFQLPPVPEKSHEYSMASTYVFDATSWLRCISRPTFLSQVFRQKDDVFVDILSSMRTGVLTSQHIEQLQQLSRPLHYADGIEPSQLYPLRVEVERCNNSRLNALEGPEHIYKSMDSAGYNVQHQPISKDAAEILLDRLVSVSKITLKIGAQVMLIQNVEQGVLVNGSVGKVMEFLTTREAIDRHIAIATLPQTSNPPQTAKPPPSEILDLKPPPSLSLRPINDNVFGHKERWPMVRFTNGRELLCAPLAFSIQGFKGNIEAHRLQVPLILAWALSIHKSQGQTLTRVKVDLGRVFEKGQAYVALSRATTMENLELQNFQPSKVMAHPRVLAWHKFWSRNDVQSHDEDSSYDEMDTEEAISQYWESIP